MKFVYYYLWKFCLCLLWNSSIDVLKKLWKYNLKTLKNDDIVDANMGYIINLLFLIIE